MEGGVIRARAFPFAPAITSAEVRPARRLTRLRRSETKIFHQPTSMGQQLNKHIKRKRRAAYNKRKKILAKTTAKAAAKK